MVLVIGYGNELRRDDGVGPRVARAVAEWNLPGVAALDRHQLTPELAEAMAAADEVFFVDASAGDEAGVCVRPLCPNSQRLAPGHTSNPDELLALTQALYGRRPRAWLITVPAPDLGLGEELSAAAACGVGEALRYLRGRIEREVSDA
jgi:hydrogenase maturation protease